MKKIVLQICFGFIVIPSLVIGAIYYLNRTGFFNVERIDIVLIEAPSRPQFLKPQLEKIDQLCEKFRGQSLWTTDLNLIAKELSSQNWIESHRVSRSWPSTLTIKIKPYEVKFLYMQGRSGKLSPVIADGRMLDMIDSKQTPDIPILEGEKFAQNIELRKKAVKVLDAIPKEGSFSRQTISEFGHDEKDGFWVNMMKSGLQVKMGEDQIAIKSARVSQVLDYMQGKQFEAKSIDANLSKKVLVKMK